MPKRKARGYLVLPKRGVGSVYQDLPPLIPEDPISPAGFSLQHPGPVQPMSRRRVKLTSAQLSRIARNRRQAIARRALRIQRRVNIRLARGELKYVEGYYDLNTIHALSVSAADTWADCEANPRQNSAVYGCMPVPKGGTGFYERDGRKIVVRNIRIYGVIEWGLIDSVSPASANLGQIVRLIVVFDTRTNKATLNAEDVIGRGYGSDGNSLTGGTASCIMEKTKPEGWGRYRILKDKMFRRPPAVATADNGADTFNVPTQITPFKFTIKRSFEVNFTDSVGAVTSVIDNSVHLLAACTATDCVTQLAYQARTSFTG